MPLFKHRKDPMGTYLFDRGTGLNILCDEIQYQRDEWDKAPRYVSIALTNACNLACEFCYAPKNNAQLLFRDVVQWARELDNAGCLGLGFGGGEPTLYAELPELCKEVMSSTTLATTLTTHGLNFDHRLSCQLFKTVHFIRLSMDGVEKIYESIRGRPFSEFLEGMKIVRDTAPFGINYVLNNQTAPYLDEAAGYAFEWGAEEMLLLPEVKNDGTFSLNSEMTKAVTEWVSKNYKKCRLSCSQMGIAKISAPYLPISDGEYSDWQILHIDAAGFMKRSAFTKQGVCIADYHNLLDSIEALRALPKD